MIRRIDDPSVVNLIAARRTAARTGQPVDVTVDGAQVRVDKAFASPADWRDVWIYFLLVDRFNNPTGNVAGGSWDQKYDRWQGGTFEGVRRQLPYLKGLGVGAIWLSPVLRAPAPGKWDYTYPGYGAQDLLTVEPRFGTPADLVRLVREAHDLGMYVIQDIVLNHAARVFDYVVDGHAVDYQKRAEWISCSLGSEPPIQWINGYGFPRSDWTDTLPAGAAGADDAVWPEDLQRPDFWRRRGDRLTDAPPDDGYIPGDFGTMRQLVTEYDASSPSARSVRDAYGTFPVLDILIRCYEHAVARYDFDGMRIDTAKYLRPEMIETFGNAMREFGLSIGKKNFFTVGEVWESDTSKLDAFIGRHTSGGDGLGIDAALDFPLQGALKSVVKGPAQGGVEALRSLFIQRKKSEAGRISSHGEAGRYFVTFLDNHDMHERFKHPQTPDAQVTLALALLFTLQGIPCVYYGTEQGLVGTTDGSGNAKLDSFESVREALWGRPNAFDPSHPMYAAVRALSTQRLSRSALRYGRLYFREVSRDGSNFSLPSGAGDVIAFSRILNDEEVVVVANVSTTAPWSGSVLVDYDIQSGRGPLTIVHSNVGTLGAANLATVNAATFWADGGPRTAACPTRAVVVSLAPMEVQVLA